MSNLIPLEFMNQRIMTTKTLAEQFMTDEKIVSNNFNRNIERFISGKHFIKLEGDELRDFKGVHLNDESLKYVSILYLWTDRGAARHAKILETDEAWEVYERLEETYFTVNSLKPQSIEDLIIMQAQSMKDMRYQLQMAREQTLEVKEEVQAIREVVTFNPKDNWREETNKIIAKVCKHLNDYKLPKEEIYKGLQQRAACDLKRRLDNMKGRIALEGATKTKLNNLNYLDVIAEDKKLTEIYIQIVRELAIKYKVA